MLVVTVGASVEPYVRFTRQPNARAVSSTKAGVTEAPPLETRRTDETSTPGPSARARAIAMKKVGGPARNEMLSLATRASACSGSKRRTRTDRSPAAPGTSTPLSSPEMWAIGAGIEHGVGRAEAVHLRHQAGLPAQGAVGVEHRLRHARRSRGEQDECDVGGPAGTSAHRHGCAAERAGQSGRVGDGIGRELEDQRRVDLGESRLDVAGPE